MIDQYGVQLEYIYRVPFLQYACPIADSEWRRAQVDNPVTVAIMDAYRDLIYKEHVMPTPTSSAELGMLPMFEAGRIGIFASSAYAMESFRKTPIDWDTITLPWFEHEGKKYRGTGLWQEEFMIMANTDVPEEAWAFAKWCAGRDAIRWAAQEGHIVPARLDVAYSEAFLNPKQKPANARAFLDSWEFATPVYSHPWLKRIATDFDPIWQQFMEGTDGVRTETGVAMKRMNDTLQKILDDYHAEHD